MPETILAPDASMIDSAFAALRTYDHGSPRAALLPIDDAVAAASREPARRAALERRLLEAFHPPVTTAARAYLCAKLALIGSHAAVPTLVDQLDIPQLDQPARTALEAIPGREATEALHQKLAAGTGANQVGVIQSLGSRSDPSSVVPLLKILADEKSSLACAAVAALGEIGTTEAAVGLRTFLPKTPEPLRGVVADAILVCAERLAAASNPKEAAELYELINRGPFPNYVQAAAQRGLLGRR